MTVKDFVIGALQNQAARGQRIAQSRGTSVPCEVIAHWALAITALFQWKLRADMAASLGGQG